MGIFSKFFGALKKTKDAISKKISQMEDPLNTYNNTSSTRINNSLRLRSEACNNINTHGVKDKVICCFCFKK